MQTPSFIFMPSNIPGGAHQFEVEELDVRLLQESQIPDTAREAPIASWVLARLGREVGSLRQIIAEEQLNDGGAFSVNLVVRRQADEALLGAVQIQGGTHYSALSDSLWSRNPGTRLSTSFWNSSSADRWTSSSAGCASMTRSGTSKATI